MFVNRDKEKGRIELSRVLNQYGIRVLYPSIITIRKLKQKLIEKCDAENKEQIKVE